MKKFFGALIVAGSMAGLNAFACGGMTQISPPSLQLKGGEPEPTAASILDEMVSSLVLC